MPLDISVETETLLARQAEANGLDVETYLRRLMAADEADFLACVEEALEDVQAGRVRPAREALSELGVKLGISR